MFPQGPGRRTRTYVVLAFLLFFFDSVGARAQVFDLDEDRVPMTDLTGPWRFHPGDAPAWSQPDFDDHAWPLIRTDRGWTEQGYKGYGGFAWYRLLVTGPKRYRKLSLYVPNVDEVCEIFAGGKLVGSIGRLPPTPQIVNDPHRIVSIPDDVVVPGQPTLLAIRVWLDPEAIAGNEGGLHPPPRIGEAAAISEWRKLQDRNTFWESATDVIDLYSNILVAFACLIMFALRRSEREYLWYGFNQIAWAGFQVELLHFNFLKSSLVPWGSTFVCVTVLAFYTRLEFIVSLIGRRPTWLYWTTIICICGVGAGEYGDIFRPGELSSIILSSSVILYLTLLMLTVMISGRKGTSDAHLVLIPFGLQFLVEAVFLLATICKAYAPVQVLEGFMQSGIQWPFPVSGETLAGDFESLAIMIILIRRFARSRRDEERLKAEVEAARVVQQVLVPEEIPEIAGFAVEAVYKPAGQVGGDFFQIIPAGRSGALIVIGDVSGKGMPAAMTVSLLVGTVRTLAHFWHSPGQILAAMNQRMVARSRDGFTTCLVARVETDGSVTAANAGHLAPYVDGSEVSVNNGLPLGLLAGAEYEETQFTLDLGQQLTLITDGVVEAQSKGRELFGFERAAERARESAEQIADSAVSFGQQDDITVVTVKRIVAGITESASVLGLASSKA